MLIDRFGRQITYLRVSVTDRCNFRCVYCLPPDGMTWVAHEAIMRYEEILVVVRVAAENGVREVRLTGGEPLVRHGLPELVRMISNVPGIEDISLTTNAVLLAEHADALAEAGLRRVNISLDTFDAQKFERITRGGSFERAMRGLEAAERVGFSPIKINVVAMRGVNDDEFIQLAELTRAKPWHIRFIELMPFTTGADWGRGLPHPSETFISIQEMLKMMEPLGLVPIIGKIGSGPSREYRIPGAAGRVGFISPVGEHFCQSCNRLRLTADGNLRPCLLRNIEIPILPAIRAGEPILPILQQAVSGKPVGHELGQSNGSLEGRTMQAIGG